MELDDILLSDNEVNAIEDGAWVGNLPDAPGLRLKVRGWSSQKVQSLKSRKERAVPLKERDIDKQILPEVMVRIVREIVHEAVLLDWEGLSSNGEPVPYSKETAAKFVLSRKGDKFLGIVTEAARRVDEGLFDQMEELEKN